MRHINQARYAEAVETTVLALLSLMAVSAGVAIAALT